MDETAILSEYYAEWFNTWAAPISYNTHVGVGGRLISRGAVRDNVTALVAVLRDMFEDNPEIGGIGINGLASNVTEARFGSAAAPGASDVLPAWRDALFTMNFGYGYTVDAGWDTFSTGQAWLNAKQNELRASAPGGGTYMNEATWDNPTWKEDYFGSNHALLQDTKAMYDPEGLFWATAAVGSDRSWVIADDGRLCKP